MVRAATLAVMLAGLGFAAAGCGGSGSAAQGSTTKATAGGPRASFQAFQTCLKGKGVTRPFGPTGRPRTVTTPSTRPRGGFFTRRNLTPAQRQALQACRSKLPSGGRFATGRRLRSSSPAFAKYTQCLAKHGVKFGARGSRTTFAKAQAACRSLLPTPRTGSG